MGSSKKHKKDRDTSTKRRSRSRSRSEERDRKKPKKNREKDRERRHRGERTDRREPSYHSDSESNDCNRLRLLTLSSLLGSDVVEVIPIAPDPPKPAARKKSLSPIPADGAGDSLSIEETNKLRAKLGLKPLEVGPSSSSSAPPPPSVDKDDDTPVDKEVANLARIKDDWGEFYHKPAGVFNEKSEVELLREKIASRKEKRKIEDKLARIKTLGESDSDDDANKWVEKSRKINEEKAKAKLSSKRFDDFDEELDDVKDIKPIKKPAKRPQRSPQKPTRYTSRDLQGIKVGHDIESFAEERNIILTLKDQDVLGEEGDELVNVNMIDDERYKKNVELRKQDPKTYGYNVYEEQYDQFGNFVGRGLLSKYDDEINGSSSKAFTIGESKELIMQQKRLELEVKAKLQNKRIETLNFEPLKLASDHYTEEEMTKFKKPKKKVKKTRSKLKADDLLTMTNEESKRDHGRRRRHDSDDDEAMPQVDDVKVKVEVQDDELERMLKKARRLKQKEELIKKDVPVLDDIKTEIKMESEETEGENNIYRERENGLITLNQTAEFCRTLGDIPTYGMAGNREDNEEMIDMEVESEDDGNEEIDRGKWNSVNPNEEPKLVDGIPAPQQEEVAILDEEPDVATGMAAALNLAMSKGYIEVEDSNRPSNTRLSHLLSKNYSIDDKTHGEDDKYAKRGHNNADRYIGNLQEFREKANYKPNVKLEYIDDNNQKLTPKEAFRYLSHKFHGKGPGKNKVEKRLKKIDQDLVRKFKMHIN